jgi:hypothetical protein
MVHEVEKLEVAPQLVAAIKTRTTLTRIGIDIGKGFGLLVEALGRQGSRGRARHWSCNTS